MDATLEPPMRIIEPEIKFGPMTNAQYSSEHAPLSMSHEFRYNGYGTLYLLTRDGICYTLRSFINDRNALEVPGLTVYASETISIDVNVDIQRESMSSGTRSQALVDNIRSAPLRRTHKDVYISYFVSDQELTAAGGSAYVADIDVVISVVDPIENSIRHPFGSAAAASGGLGTIEAKRLKGAHMRMLFIDNERVMGDKWFRLGEICIHLRPTVSDQLASGIYLIYQGSSDNAEVRRYWPLKEVQAGKLPIRMFNSQAEAAAWDEEREHELQTAAFKRDTESTKNEGTRQKQITDEISSLRKERDEANERYDSMVRTNAKQLSEAAANIRQELEDRLNRERKDAEERLATEKRRHEEEVKQAREDSERKRKEWYEERSYERKNLNEILKLIPVVASIVLSIVVLTKSKSSK